MTKLRRGFTGIEILVAITVLGVLGGGTAVAADNAKPGDALFAVDRALENLQERTTNNPVRKFELKVNRAQERAQELAALEEENETSPNQQTAERIGQATELTNNALQQAQQTVSTLARSVPANEQSSAQESLQKVSTLLQSLQQTQQETRQRVSKLKSEIKDNETKQKLETVAENGLRQVVKTEEKVDPETGEVERRVKVYQINRDGTETKVLDVKEKQEHGQTMVEIGQGDEDEDESEELEEEEAESTETPEPTEQENEDENEEEPTETPEPSETPEPTEAPEPSETPEPTEATSTEEEEVEENREAETYEIKWEDNAFEDASRTINAGDSVEWKNDENNPIRVISDDLSGLDSGSLQKGEEYKYTFVNPGTYSYQNQLSSGSGGTITVK